jgi:hypothetical protein
MREALRRYRRFLVGLCFALCAVGTLMATFNVGRSVGVAIIAVALLGVVSTGAGAAGAAGGGS